ncbi:MAG: hypothetical protein ACI4WX_04000 [Aristaeellaceae bacterium]
MERWENRYARSRSSAHVAEHSRAERIKSIAIILLLVAAVGVGIVGGRAIVFRGKTEELLISRAMTECAAAVNQGSTLSRSGGSDTAGALGKIRANINAVDVLSGLRQSLYGRVLAPKTDFTQLYEIIDSYSAKLKNGSSTIDELTRLNEGLAALQSLLQQAK